MGLSTILAENVHSAAAVQYFFSAMLLQKHCYVQ